MTSTASHESRTGLVPRAITVALFSLVLVSLFVQRNASLPILPAPLSHQFQPGDVIFLDFYDGWQHNGYWDHIALVVASQPREGGSHQLIVVEAGYSRGVYWVPLRAFLESNESVGISVKRLKDMPSRGEVIQQATDYAFAQVGKPFDRIAITGVLPLKITAEKIHCAELVWRAYKVAGIDLDSDRGIFILAEDIYHSPLLELGWIS